MPRFKSLVVGLLVLTGTVGPPQNASGETMDPIAEQWVKLALSMGLLEDGYVDAYQGPEEWQAEAAAQAWSLEQVSSAAAASQQALAAIPTDGLPAIEVLRHRNLTKLLSSMQARIAMLQGKKFTFDEESMALYDAVAPHHEPQHFQKILDHLDELLPGEGSLGMRRNAFREWFIIPPNHIDAVFQAAIAECRKRTLPRIALPAGEGFTVEYVEGKPWSAYNWFQGNSHSLIQVNTDLPIYIDRAVDLACHEGYPGHHVYNLLLEQELYKKRGWVEFCIYVLYGPQALIAEGSANYGIEMTFPGNDRIEFEKQVLFPIAGIDPELADRYYKVEELVKKLAFAANETARDYLDGRIDREAAVKALMTYSLLTPELAERRLRFIDTYRSYVISYNLGEEIVGTWIESTAGREASTDERWKRFIQLLSEPYIPSELR
jgi:hypothetical protein